MNRLILAIAIIATTTATVPTAAADDCYSEGPPQGDGPLPADAPDEIYVPFSTLECYTGALAEGDVDRYMSLDAPHLLFIDVTSGCMDFRAGFSQVPTPLFIHWEGWSRLCEGEAIIFHVSCAGTCTAFYEFRDGEGTYMIH